MPTYNPDAKAPTFELLKGTFPFEIVAVENYIQTGNGKTRGRDVREVTFDFYKDDSFQVKIGSIKDDLIDYESCLWKWSLLAKCVGWPLVKDQEFDVTEEWKGYRGWAICEPEDDRSNPPKKDASGKVRQWNRVQVYLTDKPKLPPREGGVPNFD